ncbi:MAG: type II toxin-antitoxin system VapB family antitoxin [Planctomycetota bacterium]|nr:type II toxin-antitoxin system VapB family antitoxin [Planctomycetota bacterium]
MRLTLTIDEQLLRDALRLSGLRTRADVVNAGLQSLISRLASEELATLGGSDPSARAGRRRRTTPRGRKRRA